MNRSIKTESSDIYTEMKVDADTVRKCMSQPSDGPSFSFMNSSLVGDRGLQLAGQCYKHESSDLLGTGCINSYENQVAVKDQDCLNHVTDSFKLKQEHLSASEEEANVVRVRQESLGVREEEFGDVIVKREPLSASEEEASVVRVRPACFGVSEEEFEDVRVKREPLSAREEEASVVRVRRACFGVSEEEFENGRVKREPLSAGEEEVSEAKMAISRGISHTYSLKIQLKDAADMTHNVHVKSEPLESDSVKLKTEQHEEEEICSMPSVSEEAGKGAGALTLSEAQTPLMHLPGYPSGIPNPTLSSSCALTLPEPQPPHVYLPGIPNPALCCSNPTSDSTKSTKHSLKKSETNLKGFSKERPFVCDQCQAAFKKAVYLKRHLRIHSGVKPHKCEQCGKAFIHRSELSIHERSHSGEKPYKCTQCDANFAQSGHLQVHTRTHTGEGYELC